MLSPACTFPLAMRPETENGFCTPGAHPTFVRLNTAAQRAGLKIVFRMQQGERGPEMVLTLGGLKQYFKTLRARVVAA